jgi:hypothetical protein
MLAGVVPALTRERERERERERDRKRKERVKKKRGRGARWCFHFEKTLKKTKLSRCRER